MTNSKELGIIEGMKQLTHDAKKRQQERRLKMKYDFRELTRVIFAKPLDFVDKMTHSNLHQKKQIAKTESTIVDEGDREFLKNIITSHSDFVLSHLEETEVDMLIDAMEKYNPASGETVISQGDSGYYLYIVKAGSLKYDVDGENVGAANPGDVFGELALLYDCPRQATVVADSDCHLYRVHRETFRMIQAQFVLSNDDETRRLLLKNRVFGGLPEDILRELASYMFQRPFKKGDMLLKRGEDVDEIYFLRRGQVIAKDLHHNGVDYANIELNPGDCFGDRAILIKEQSMANVECLSDGVAYVLTKERFLNCMDGTDIAEIVQKGLDAKVLSVMPFMVNSDISRIEILQMARKLKYFSLEPGEVLASIGDEVEPSLYFIATSSLDADVEKTTSDGITTKLAPSQPFGFGNHAFIIANLDETAAAIYEKEHNLHNQDIHAIKKNIVERNVVVSQITVKVVGTETVHFRKLVLNDIKGIIHDIMRLGKHYDGDHFENTSITHEVLEKKQLLGQGTFGQVWLCRDPAQNAPIALKIQYKLELIQQHQAAGVIRESQIMRKMHHPFVMGLVNVQQDARCLYMMMDIVQGGELRQQMRNVDRDHLSEPAAKFYAACILEGLAYMHRRNFIYRDLKGENILIDKDGYCVIIDLGFAKHVPDKTFTFCGTPIFISPEILLNQGHDKSADIWSFGVMIYEMLFGTNPFFDYDDPSVNQRLLFKRIVKLDFQRPKKQSSLVAYSNTSREAKDLIKKILVTKPNKRLGCMGQGDLAIRRHPWFRDIDFGKLYRKELEAPWVPEIKDHFDGTNFKETTIKDHSGLRNLTDLEQKKFEEFF